MEDASEHRQERAQFSESFFVNPEPLPQTKVDEQDVAKPKFPQPN